MTSIKTLAISSLLLVSAGVALARPESAKVLPGAAAKGSTAIGFQVMTDLGTAPDNNGATAVTGVEIHLTFDPAKITFTDGAKANFVLPSGSTWTTQSFALKGTTELIVIATNDGTPAGYVGTINGTLVSPTKVRVTTDSAISDDGFNTTNPVVAIDVAGFTGAYRNLGGAIVGAPSTGPGKVVAVAAGTTLRLLKGADLTDVAGFTAPTVGPVSGRPAFGMIGPLAVLAVGDDAGKLTVVDAATGAAVGTQVTLAGKVSTPAIAVDAIYAGVTPATGKATLVKVIAGVASPVATLAGTTVLGSPAVYLGGIVVGTDAGVEIFRADGTPQAGVADAAGATIAPIIGAGGKGLSANATKLLGFNALTGAAAGATGATGGAVSEAWYEASTNMVVLGTASGKILQVNLTSGTPTLAATAITAGAVSAEPIVLAGVTYVIDATGNVASSTGLSAPLGGPGAKALAATGQAAGDTVVAATTAGVLAALTL